MIYIWEARGCHSGLFSIRIAKCTLLHFDGATVQNLLRGLPLALNTPDT